MVAMLDNLDQAIGPWDRNRIGLRTSLEANERIRAWQRLALRLTP